MKALNVRVLLVTLLFIFVLSLRTQFSQFGKAGFDTIRVPSDYSTIQGAVNAASEGSIILVSAGVYHEHVIVNKTLNLIGAGKTDTIVDGSQIGTAIMVTANNVVIDGFTVQNCSSGICISYSSNCTVSENIITLNSFNGVLLDHSKNNSIVNNLISSNEGGYPGLMWGNGVDLNFSYSNMIKENIITESGFAIVLFESNNNSIEANTIENRVGIQLFSSNGSLICHNIFIGVGNATIYGASFHNRWSDGKEGNYWDSYTGVDDGSDGRVAGDGVGDTLVPYPYAGIDDYPFVRPPAPIPVVWKNTVYPVSLKGNSTVSMFRFTQSDKKITFTVTGPGGTMGWCNVTIPKSLLRGSPWKIMLNNTDITPQATITQNQTHTFVYFTYDHAPHAVQIIGTAAIPEFPTNIVLATALILMSVLAFLKKKPNRKTTAHL
jgi:parallel beta-helix repeat protein